MFYYLEEEARRLTSSLENAERLAQVKPTPFLVIDKSVIRQKYEELQRAFSEAKVFYSIKANPHRGILKLLQGLGAGFEISSEGELNLLLRSGVSPRGIISSNPIKGEAFIRAAHRVGIDLLAFDSYAEVEKLSAFAPGSRVYLRLYVSNRGSEWPLNQKFGVEEERAVELLAYAGEMGLKPYGITFHVGSQCTEVSTWEEAIQRSGTVWESARKRGIELSMLNIGGGFPVRYTTPVHSIADIAQVVKDALRRNLPADIEVIAEPGRYLVAEAGILVATVIAKAVRNGQKWLYLDAGVFNSLMESLGGTRYPLAVQRNAPLSKWVIAGPSCDGFDVVCREVELPELEMGDKLYIMSAGAYTTAYASEFNGFPLPKTYFR